MEGVIKADVSIVSPKAVGKSSSMLVLVSLERERADIIDKFKKAIKSSAVPIARINHLMTRWCFASGA
ncbi:hypothetical protein [Bradyrhizobium diversitatis]|uniref:hypothetical protein n=1 Tax=Bradyrhizobium diversitatis TaxID=2755406 RepID=UPI0035DFE4F2